MKLPTGLIAAPTVPAIIYFAFPDTAGSPYIETGGFIIPWIVAALLGASVLIRTYWGRIRSLLGRRPREDADVGEDDGSAEDGPSH